MLCFHPNVFFIPVRVSACISDASDREGILINNKFFLLYIDAGNVLYSQLNIAVGLP